MEIRILSLCEGAEKAEGVTVIIDVFRAFTLEAWLFSKGASCFYVTADAEYAYKLKKKMPECYLIGERKGRIMPGFDFGNSPDAIKDMMFEGHQFIHTTTNGTQGIDRAVKATTILTGSLVNAKATAKYIASLNPEIVSLVAMGWEGHETEEDLLCAEYIKSILEGKPMQDIKEQADALRYTEGKKFFDPLQQDVFPEGDFHMCVKPDIFDFAIEVKKENGVNVSRRVRV